MAEAPADLEQLRQDLRGHLHADRAVVRGRGHDWDVADVVAVVIREYGWLITGAQPALVDTPGDPVVAHGQVATPKERVAILATGSDLRRAADDARTQVGRMMDRSENGSDLYRHLLQVYRTLDVATAEDRLMRPPDSHGQINRHRGKPSPPVEPFTSPARSGGLRRAKP